MYSNMTDIDLIDLLEEVDNDEDVTMSTWEAEFTQSMFDLVAAKDKALIQRPKFTLSQRQRLSLISILEKYLGV